MRIYGVTGRKNSGKTGLVERLVAEISARGLKVSTVKHAHHAAEIDEPGRDSWRHRAAGATEVLLATPQRWALMHELRGAPEPGLDEQLAKFSPADLLLIEGFKQHGHPQIECLRRETGTAPLAPDFPSIRAQASNYGDPGFGLPVFDLDDTAAIADFILKETGLDRLEAAAAFAPPDPDLSERLRAIRPLSRVEEIPLAQALGRIPADPPEPLPEAPLRLAEIAQAAALGLERIRLRPRLRIGIRLASGVDPAISPMLSAALAHLGHEPVAENPDFLILVRGGAETPPDLTEEEGLPVFHLPGDPAAALACAALFVFPALALRSGAGWRAPEFQERISGVSFVGKPGAGLWFWSRIDARGHVEILAPEDFAQASGLAEAPQAALRIHPGDRLRRLPFSGFGF